jgi:hypothetical protein
MMLIWVTSRHAQQTWEQLSELPFIFIFRNYHKRKMFSKPLLTNTMSKSEVPMESIPKPMMVFSIFQIEEDLEEVKNN